MITKEVHIQKVSWGYFWGLYQVNKATSSPPRKRYFNHKNRPDTDRWLGIFVIFQGMRGSAHVIIRKHVCIQLCDFPGEGSDLPVPPLDPRMG